MIRTASLIAAFLFLPRRRARRRRTLAANAVLNNSYISGFFLDGLATPPSSFAADLWRRDKNAFAGAVKLVVVWGFGFALAVAACFLLSEPALIDIMTASVDGPAHRAGLSSVRRVRTAARCVRLCL